VAGGVVALAQTGAQPEAADSHTLQAQPLTADLNGSAVSVSSPAAELINAQTGQVLYSHNVQVKHYPASIVKLMTSLLALDLVKKGQLTLNSIIPVSQAAYQVALTPGLSVAYLNPMEHIPLWKMLEYMYVVSADDAAVALGDAIAGNETQFAALMNAKAKALHMDHTHYTNASGLQNPDQYTTAHDIGILARHLVDQFPVVLKYASLPGMYIHPGQYGTNYDQLLGQYRGLDGLKTGSTSQAGYCFVGTAQRGNTRLISIVLDDQTFSDAFQDTSTLLDFGFNQFRTKTIQKAGQGNGMSVYVPNGTEQSMPVAPDQPVVVMEPATGRVHVQTTLTQTVAQAPVLQGQAIGYENVIMSGHVVQQVPVYSLKADPKAGLVEKLWRSLLVAAHHGARSLVHAVVHKLSRWI